MILNRVQLRQADLQDRHIDQSAVTQGSFSAITAPSFEKLSCFKLHNILCLITLQPFSVIMITEVYCFLCELLHVYDEAINSSL